MLALLCPIIIPSGATADDKDDKVREKQQVDRRLSQLRDELSETNTDLSSAYIALAETELQIPDAQRSLDAARGALDSARQEDERVGKRLRDAQREERELQGQAQQKAQAVVGKNQDIDRLALAAYKGGGVPSAASVFVGIANPQEAVDRSKNYTLTLQAQGASLSDLRVDQAVTSDRGDRLSAVRREINELKKQSEAAVRTRQEAEQQASTAKQQLDSLYTQQKTQTDALQQKKKEYEGRQSTLESQSAELDQQIQTLIQQEKQRELERQRQEEERRRRENADRPAPAPGGDDSGGGSGGGGQSGRGFLRPVNAPLNSNFGYRYHPIFHTRILHAGVDFAAACGTPVKATKAGKVLATEYRSLAGNKVTISHGLDNGVLVTSSYHHLQGFAVSPGQRVSQGQVVGYVGTTGSSTGCHLHFEIQHDGTPVNPAPYL